MNEQIMNAIVELVKEGGQVAIWIYCVGCLTIVLKYMIGFGIGFGTFAYIIKKIIEAVKEFNNKE